MAVPDMAPAAIAHVRASHFLVDNYHCPRCAFVVALPQGTPCRGRYPCQSLANFFTRIPPAWALAFIATGGDTTQRMPCTPLVLPRKTAPNQWHRTRVPRVSKLSRLHIFPLDFGNGKCTGTTVQQGAGCLKVWIGMCKTWGPTAWGIGGHFGVTPNALRVQRCGTRLSTSRGGGKN